MPSYNFPGQGTYFDPSKKLQAPITKPSKSTPISSGVTIEPGASSSSTPYQPSSSPELEPPVQQDELPQLPPPDDLHTLPGTVPEPAADDATSWAIPVAVGVGLLFLLGAAVLSSSKS